MGQIEYYVMAITLFFIASIALSFIVIHRRSISEILKNAIAHTAWLLLWIPSFFISFKLALLIPAGWLAYVLIQYERRSLKIKSQAAETA